MEWISVEDRLPKEYQEVLLKQIYNDDLMIGFVSGNGWVESCQNIDISGNAYVETVITTGKKSYDKITHWQPLPKPPKESK